jgi:XTP/dITP diphosphohydrolase
MPKPRTTKGPRRLTIVTHNPGKVREFQAGLSHRGIELHHLNRTYHELQADTLEEVASFGLQDLAAEVEGDFCLEDSGLFIDALHGFPGVYSAYVYRTVGLNGLLKLLKGVEDRRASFASVIAVSWEGETHLFRGEVAGQIARAPRGTEGFGYDPIFIPDGERSTFAQMSLTEKLKHSHRGRALEKVRAFLTKEQGATKGTRK